MSKLSELIEREFPKRQIAVIGDLVADQFLRGTISRVSREAPVFILRHDETETLSGGAANAAANTAALGAKTLVVGIVGNDVNGDSLVSALKDANVETRFIARSPDFKTTTKVRVLAGQHYAPRQQVIRIDYENRIPISEAIRQELASNAVSAIENADAVIFSDYNYGAAEPWLFRIAKKEAGKRKIPIVVDSRFRLTEYAGATSATPNQEEVEQLLGSDLRPEKCSELCRSLKFTSLLATLGNKGMLLAEPGKPAVRLGCIGSSDPIDVTGAGDTVIAAYTLGLASGLEVSDAAAAANHAGGIVVMKKGTATADLSELSASIKGAFNE